MNKLRLVGVASFFLLVGHAHAITVSLDPVDFGTANDDQADGTFDWLSSNIEAASTGNSVHRGLIEFDLSLIQGTVASAELTLRMAGGDNPPNDVEFHGYMGNGAITLDDALVDNLITIIEVQSFPSNPTNENTLVKADVTSFVQTLPDYAGFMLRMTDETLDHAQRFSDNDVPYLSVSYNPIPLPPSVWLFGSGLLGLIRVTRRKKMA